MKKIFCFLTLLVIYSYTQAQDFCSVGIFPNADSVLKMLNTYRKGTIEPVYPMYFIPSKGSITDSVKQRLLAILKREWTKEEINPKIEYHFREYFEWGYLNTILGNSNSITMNLFSERYNYYYDLNRVDTAKPMSKSYKLLYDSIYKVYYDSLAIPYKKEIEKQIKEDIVPDEIVAAVGTARIYEAIPILKADLASKGKHYFNAEAAEVALAGLGDTIALKKVFNRHIKWVSQPQWSYDTMIYQDIDAMINVIRTQQSIFLMSDWLDTAHNHRIMGEVLTNDTIFDAQNIIPVLYCLFNNKGFKQEFLKQRNSGELGSGTFSATREQILFIRKWIITNKGKYEFD